MSPDGADQVCVVTGGGSGIGRALATRFASAGMRVAIGDIESDALAKTVADLGGDGDRVLGVLCDVRSVDDNERLRDQAVERFGRIDVVCLNAGVAPHGNVLDTPPEVWDWLFDVNVRAVFLGVHAFSPRLVDQGSGHLVLTASGAGLGDTPGLGPYSATKHAVVGLAAALRHEFAPHGVGVSVLCPGLVNTRIFESERNRPAGMADPSERDPLTQLYRDALATQGAPPQRVADAVYDAVLDNQFFVFPTSDFDGAIEGRLLSIEQGRSWRDAHGRS
jgi:NAD(P)-dependent dehydrogenase (short-subunit alcohol dehydrogenase family)